jgi:hypothetical protein
MKEWFFGFIYKCTHECLRSPSSLAEFSKYRTHVLSKIQAKILVVGFPEQFRWDRLYRSNGKGNRDNFLMLNRQ